MAAGKNLKVKSDSFLFSEDNSRRINTIYFSISVFLHGVLFIGLLFIQDFKLPQPMEPVIQIDLVSFTPEIALGQPEESAESTSASKDGIPLQKTIKPKKRVIKHIKPDISLKKKPKNLSELLAEKKKKKTPPKKKIEKKPKPQPESEPEEKVAEKTEAEEQKAKDEALQKIKERLAKEQEEREQKQIAEALERLKKGMKDQDKQTTASAGGRTSGFASKGVEPIELYHMVIGSAIEQNWVFNDTLARMDKDLEVSLIIKILKNGEIRDIFYETRSGNRYLDESAKKAIEKANPLPPLPGNRRSYDIGLKFTPRGLK